MIQRELREVDEGEVDWDLICLSQEEPESETKAGNQNQKRFDPRDQIELKDQRELYDEVSGYEDNPGGRRKIYEIEGTS